MTHPLKYSFSLLIFVMMLIFAPNSAEAKGRVLLTDVRSSGTVLRSDLFPDGRVQVGALRSRFMGIDFTALDMAAASQGMGRVVDDPGLVLNLFEDVTLLAFNTRLEARPHGAGYIWYGTIPSIPYSNVILVVGDGRVNGRVLLPSVHYYIAPTAFANDQHNTFNFSGIIHNVSEIDPGAWDDLSPVDDGLIQSEVMPSTYTRENAVPLYARGTVVREEDAEIDVMVVYTPAAEAHFEGVENTIAAIEGMIALTNQSYENSGVSQRVRLVNIERVDYVEQPANFNLDLFNLSGTSDSFMDNVHRLRKLYGADLVSLITATTPPEARNYCGIGWSLYRAIPSEGFSVSEAACETTVVMPHELGHNMGNAHDIANGGSGGWFPYSRGYQDVKENDTDYGDFVTIMAYNRNGQCPAVNTTKPVGEGTDCPHMLYWSDPTATLNGKPLGNNNTRAAQTLDETSGIIAGYMPKRIVSDILIDGGFEDEGGGLRLSKVWKAVGVRPQDKVVCNTPEQTVARNGSCAFMFKGQRNENSRIRQKITGLELTAGDFVHLEAWVKARNIVNGAKLQLRIYYQNSSGGATTANQAIARGSYDYRVFDALAQASGTVSRIVVIVRYKNPTAKGRLYIDDLRLRIGKRDTAALPLPLPPSP